MGKHTLEITNPGIGYIDVLIVGGGGGGASRCGGGGGAGGVIMKTISISTGNYPIILGKGGNGLQSNGSGEAQNGYSSYAFGEVALGGGYGSSTAIGGSGGSGGGARGNTTSARSSYNPEQGKSGGGSKPQEESIRALGGGGGGYSQPGGSSDKSDNNISKGGDGFNASKIFGTDFGDQGWFAGGGGGGGGSGDEYIAYGGKGGGGNGNSGSTDDSTAGINNTGGGGGGGGFNDSVNYNGKNGGSGIVLIRYPISEISNNFASGKYIRLQKNDTGILNIYEIEIYDNYNINIAPYGKVYKSSIYDDTNYSGDNTIDGNINSLVHTKCL